MAELTLNDDLDFGDFFVSGEEVKSQMLTLYNTMNRFNQYVTSHWNQVPEQSRLAWRDLMNEYGRWYNDASDWSDTVLFSSATQDRVTHFMAQFGIVAGRIQTQVGVPSGLIVGTPTASPPNAFEQFAGNLATAGISSVVVSALIAAAVIGGLWYISKDDKR